MKEGPIAIDQLLKSETGNFMSEAEKAEYFYLLQNGVYREQSITQTVQETFIGEIK